MAPMEKVMTVPLCEKMISTVKAIVNAILTDACAHSALFAGSFIACLIFLQCLFEKLYPNEQEPDADSRAYAKVDL